MKILLFLALVLFCHCTKPKVDPKEVRLREQWALLEQEAADLEKKIKESDSDPATKTRLIEDRELLRSRMERMKGKVKLPAAPAGH